MPTSALIDSLISTAAATTLVARSICAAVEDALIIWRAVAMLRYVPFVKPLSMNALAALASMPDAWAKPVPTICS